MRYYYPKKETFFLELFYEKQLTIKISATEQFSYYPISFLTLTNAERFKKDVLIFSTFWPLSGSNKRPFKSFFETQIPTFLWGQKFIGLNLSHISRNFNCIKLYFTKSYWKPSNEDSSTQTRIAYIRRLYSSIWNAFLSWLCLYHIKFIHTFQIQVYYKLHESFNFCLWKISKSL